MKKAKNKGLENLLMDDYSKDNHEHHFHPHEFIANHVILVVFLAMLFLFSIFVFLLSTPLDEPTVAYALIEFEPINFGIMDKLIEVKNVFVDNMHKEEFLLMLILSFAFIVGAFNIYYTEKNFNKNNR
jgi:hypothetical protein